MTTPSIISAIQKIRELLGRQEKIKLLGVVLFALVSSFFEIITASLIVIFAQVLSKPEVGQKYFHKIGFDLSPGRVVFYIALFVGIFYLIKNFFAALEVFYQNFSIQKMNYTFKDRMLRRYAESDYNLHLTRNSSLGMQVVGSDVELIFSTGVLALAALFSEGFVFTCLIGLIVYMNPSVAFFVFAIGVVLGFLIHKVLLPRFYGFGQKIQESSQGTHQNLIQFFHAFKEIILLGKKDYFIKSYQYYSRKRSRILAVQTAMNSLPRFVIEVLFIGLFLATIGFLCVDHEAPIQMMGVLGGYLYAGFRLMPALNRMISQLNTFKATIPSIERVHNEYTSVVSQQTYCDCEDFRFDEMINLKNLTFRYLNTSKDALKNIDLTIQKGESIGIIGETGSGKSTLIDVILGLLTPSQGSIVVDGTYPVSSYQWHKKIGYVPQSIYLTDNTIEANIAFGEENIDNERLKNAIHAAQLERFVESLPEGTKTFVGERGIRLSGGERQRIAIARALYHNPEVLIFDEATSALDNETESRLMETIQSICKNHTVIMIAHRLTTLKNCDRIVVMESGKIKDITLYHLLSVKK